MNGGNEMTGHGIVVAFDGTPGSEVALDWAAVVSRRQDVPLTLAYCVEMAAVPLDPVFAVESLPREIREGARGVLERGTERATTLTKPSLVRTTTVIGSASAELVLASKDAGLMVIGSRGRGALASGLLGSVSYAVAAHAYCPVVVVRGETAVRPDEDHPVVVGADGSFASHRAVLRAAEFAVASGAILRIVCVARLRSPEGWAYVEDTEAGTEHSHAVRERAARTLARARDAALDVYPGLELETEVHFGDAGDVLPICSVHAGLLVVGSRGRGGFLGLLLGSVSHTVINEATCPVMVVR